MIITIIAEKAFSKVKRFSRLHDPSPYHRWYAKTSSPDEENSKKSLTTATGAEEEENTADKRVISQSSVDEEFEEVPMDDRETPKPTFSNEDEASLPPATLSIPEEKASKQSSQEDAVPNESSQSKLEEDKISREKIASDNEEKSEDAPEIVGVKKKNGYPDLSQLKQSLETSSPPDDAKNTQLQDATDDAGET